jgi:hypothetical protein
MWRCMTTALIIVCSPLATVAGERPPFHVEQFDGETSISLTVTSMQVSSTQRFDYDVTIGLTKSGATSQTEYIDGGSHPVKVKCLPGMISVGGKDFVLHGDKQKHDWKEDLWDYLCLSVVS